MTLPAYQVRWLLNPRAASGQEYGAAQRDVLDPERAEAARREIAGWPGYAATPLLSLEGLAAACGVAAIAYKDESGRFGLGSFKALGGAFAVYRLLSQEVAAHTGRAPVTAAELAAGTHREITRRITVCCATDGNHGRAVAWGARTFGCRSVVYLHEKVSAQREAAIARYGARIERTSGNYDDAVRRAARDAEREGWVVVSDTSYEGYSDIARDVMHGYTVMAGLSCGEASLLAWSILRQGADLFMTIPDRAATDVMRLLAAGADRDPAVVAGESAGAGLAGLLAARGRPELARALGLERSARVLVFGTEGDTDPEAYRRIVGRSAEQVRAGTELA